MGASTLSIPLVGGTCILYPEGHFLVAITRHLCHKSCLAQISGVHHDLVVTREGIQETKESAFRGAVHQGINTGQRVGVLRTGLVEVRDVHTHPHLLAGLPYQYHVG